MANAITKGFFDTSLKAFAGFGSPTETDNSWELSATELFGLMFGNSGGMSSEWQSMGGLSAVVQRNLRTNGGMMVAQLIGIPLSFKYGQKLLGKSIIRPANIILAPAGVRV